MHIALLPVLAILVAQPVWAAGPGDPAEPPTTMPRAATDSGVPPAEMPTATVPSPGVTVPRPSAPTGATGVPGNPMPGPGTPFPGSDHPTPGGGAVP